MRFPHPDCITATGIRQIGFLLSDACFAGRQRRIVEVNARLARGHHGNCFAVAAEASGDPRYVDFRNRLSTLVHLPMPEMHQPAEPE
jgi:hypothetical protein